MKDRNFTLYELKLISEILNYDFYSCVMSHNKSHKKISSDLFLTHGTYECDDYRFNDLIELGVIKKFKCSSVLTHTHYYDVTLEGVVSFTEQMKELLVYKPKVERDLDYVKQRILFYCEFYNYKYGDDNAGHVFESYVKYRKREYISHTSRDCVKTFEHELKPFYKDLLKIYGKGN